MSRIEQKRLNPLKYIYVRREITVLTIFKYTYLFIYLLNPPKEKL